MQELLAAQNEMVVMIKNFFKKFGKEFTNEDHFIFKICLYTDDFDCEEMEYMLFEEIDNETIKITMNNYDDDENIIDNETYTIEYSAISEFTFTIEYDLTRVIVDEKHLNK